MMQLADFSLGWNQQVRRIMGATRRTHAGWGKASSSFLVGPVVAHLSFWSWSVSRRLCAEATPGLTLRCRCIARPDDKVGKRDRQTTQAALDWSKDGWLPPPVAASPASRRTNCSQIGPDCAGGDESMGHGGLKVETPDAR